MILNAIKEQGPYQPNNTVPSTVNTVNVDLAKNKKLVLSPKGLGESYKSKVVVDYNSGKKQIMRTSSIEDVKNQSDSKFNSHNKPNGKAYVNTVSGSLIKKQAKSP